MHNALISIGIAALLISASLPATAQAPTWHLERTAMIHPAESSPGMLGKVSQVAVLSDGSVFVAEFTPSRISLYDAKGAFVRTISNEGSGPGETREPIITVVHDTLIAFSRPLGRLTRYTALGRRIDERRVDVDGGQIWATNDGHVLLLVYTSTANRTGSAARIAPSGKIDTITWQHLATDDRHFDWSGPKWILKGNVPFAPYGVAVIDPSGHVVTGGSKASNWVVVSGRDTLRRISLPIPEVTIPAGVRDSVWSAYSARITRYNFTDAQRIIREDRIPRTLPPWVTFDIDRRGDWWVGRPGPDGELASWDVASNGRLAGRLPIPAPVSRDRTGNRVTSFAGDRVGLLHETSDGDSWIGIYRVVRSAR